MTRKSGGGSGAMLKYSRACSQEVVDQLSHITATQSIILGLQNSSSQSQSGHQEVQDHLFRPKLKKMGTLQEQSQEPNLFKNSLNQGACLDVFTELSLVTEQEEAKTMRRSERYGNNRHQSAFKNTLQQKVIAAEESQRRANQQQSVAPQHFADALSPFTPIQHQKCVDDDGAGSCGYYNASSGAPVENFVSSSGQPCQQLLFNHHHHGYSEYNPRSRGEERNQDGDARRIGGGISGSGPGSKGNQESAFNFRKQTLCEDEVMSREEDDVECVDGNDDADDKDQNSCTEVDLMTNNRGGCDINNYFSGSSKANFGGLNNQGTTPNKLLSNQFSSTVQVNSDQLMLPVMERTPLDYLSQQRQSAINGAASSSQRNAAEDAQLSEQFASTTIAERAGVANYEQVLEEDNRFGEQYKIKALPAVKKPSQASFSVQHTKTQSNSTMGMLLSSPLFPVQLASTNHDGDGDDESEDAKLFGPSQMQKQRIQVARLTSEEDIHQQQLMQQNQQLEQHEEYYGSKKPPSTEDKDAALLYVFGGAQGRAEDSMLSEEYQPQVVVQIDPSMTPDVQPTPFNRTPKNCSVQQQNKTSTHSGLSIGGNENNKEGTFPSIIIEESPRNTTQKDHQMLMSGVGGADDSKVVIQMMVSDGEDDDVGANTSSNDDENEQDRAGLLEDDDYGEEEGEGDGPQESMLASLVIESITDDDGHQEEEKDKVSEDDAMLAVGGSLGISSSYEDDEGDQASIGFLNHNQIDTSKILALQKMKNKKLKKRLSQKHQLDQTATLINERSQEVDDRQQALQYQYGFSVEQQKDNSSSRQGSTQKTRQVIRFMHSSAVRNVGKHQSSQNISNLIAKSVIGVTPKIISKNVSRERLPNLPLSKVPFTAANNSNTKHINKNNTSVKKQRPANKVGATGASSLQHHQLINFAEKAAGVISERNRKFSKPQTLKTLEQKLLHADDSDFDGVMDDDDYDEEEMDGAVQVEVFKLELPEERHNADMQLQFNSEMISIDEFESRIEDEPSKFNHINNRGGDATANRASSIGYTEVEQIADYIGVNVTSEAIEQVEGTSPILQFRSQTMADISSPRQHQQQQHQVSHFKNGARKSEATSTKPIRESMSSPNINSLKPNKVGVGYHHNQHNQHMGTSRNTMYDSTRPQNQTAGNSKQQQFHQRTTQKRMTLNGLLLNSHSGNPFSTGSAAANNRQTLVKKTQIKKSGSTSPNNRKYTNNYTYQQQQEPATKKGKMVAAQSMGRMSTMSNHLASLKQHQSGLANNEGQNTGTGARATTSQIKDLIPYTQRIIESNSAAAGHLVQQQQSLSNQQQQTASTITTSWSKKPTPMLTGVSMASNSTATLPSHVYKKRSSKAQMAQIVCGNSTYKGPHHKRKASANKLIMDSSAQLHLVGATPTNSQGGGGNQRYPRVGSQLQHSLNPNNLSAMNFGGVTSSQLNQHVNGAPKTNQTTIGTHIINNSSNKAKQHVRSSQKLATTSISKRHSTKQQHSSQAAAAHLSSGGSKLSMATFSGGKMKQPPPKQPTLITSPVTKVAPMMGADHQNSISLRVLQTPSGFTQQAASNTVVNSIAAANLKLSTLSAQGGSSFKQENNKVMLHKNVPEPSSSSAHKTTQNNNRLATVSSRKSVVSQTRSGKSLKSSMLSQKKVPMSSASKQDSNHAHHCASTGKKKQVHAQSESTMQIDREAYQKWNEEVEERNDGFARQNSEHFKEQWQFRQQSNYSARNHEKALKQLQQIKSGKQSIFEVVDDIMNSLQTPYGASRSPDIRSGGGDRSKIPKLTSGQPLLIEDDMEPLSVERSAHDGGGGSAQNTKHFYSSQKALGPHQYATKGFETQHHCDTGRVRVKNNLTTPLAGSNSMQLNTEMTQESELRKPCGGNFRIEPVLPEMGSPPEDEIAQPEKTFPTLESETDGHENAGQMNSGLTPYHALAVLKQKTPFRNKNRGGRNETTSVEVLMLDGSEFVSMSDTTPSQNVARTTEEPANKTAITNTKRVPLNTTFQYTVIQQPPPCDQTTDKDSIAPSLPESNSMPNSLTTAPIINEHGPPLSAATTERASTSRRMIATHGQVSATSLTSLGSKQPQPQLTQKRSQQNIIEQISRQNDLSHPQRNIKRKQSKQIADNSKGGSFLSNILSGGGPQTTSTNTNNQFGGGVFSASSTPVYKHNQHVGVQSQKITGRKETNQAMTSNGGNATKPLQQQYYQQKKSKKVAVATRKNGLATGQKNSTNSAIQQTQQQLKVKRQSTFNNSMTINTSMSGEPTQPTSQQQLPKQKQTTYLAIPGANIQRPVTTTQTLSSGKRSVGGGGMATGSSVKHMAPGGTTIKMMKYPGGGSLQHHHTSCQSARGHQSSRGSVAHVAPQIMIETEGANHRSVSIGSNHQQQNSRKPLSPQPTLKIAANSNIPLNNNFAKKVSLDLGGGTSSSSVVKPFRLSTGNGKHNVHVRNDSGGFNKDFQMLPNFSRSLLLSQQQSQLSSQATRNPREDQRSQE